MKIDDIKGVGPKIKEIFKEKGIVDIPSLLYTIPSSYLEFRLTGFSYTSDFNAEAILIDEVSIRKLQNKTKVSFSVMINNLKFEVVSFNTMYLKKILSIGSEVVLCGRYSNEYRAIIASKVFLKEDYKEGIVPEYRIEGISDLHMQKIMMEAINYYEPREMTISENYFHKYGFDTGRSLILSIHHPESTEEANKAIEALKYYELLSFCLKMALIRKNLSSLRKTPKKYDIKAVKDFISLSIHFDFTEDQKNAVNEIFKYLQSEVPLNMLLQGDTGSGKTIVSIVAAYAVYTAGYQSLLMVPTETLAYQHYKTFSSYLSMFGVNVSLLTASASGKERNKILNDLNNGDCDIVIGTHSLLSDEVKFKKLGFIICDEQHKFGVEQRKVIREKSENPDVLYMTATPIPRTLALTAFKDMNILTIRSMPKGRKKIITKIYDYKNYLKVLDFVKSEIEDHHQAYFVAPSIEDNEELSLNGVLKIKNDLEKYYSQFKIGLLHGRLSEDEKEKVLMSFLNHEIDILVSTSVIEVGIDAKAATVMVVIDADRFGLSQLHQLRGRVGRSEDSGYCFLMVKSVEKPEKLSILEETQDGFLISEQDLKDRGPGDFLGVSQSGLLKFRFADLEKDKDILQNAVKDADEIIQNDEKTVSFYQNHLYSDNFD
ncbi:MAG: ATP-dependent DNA helicase RecG [Bacillales bacterium]|nr:ATP-dependent DNA helicase RecG [Bacillales bacterium]